MEQTNNELLSFYQNGQCIWNGRIKWFNNKVGYGFITITDSRLNSNIDIFVHHSSINVQNQQYKYLVEGEYVEFNLINTKTGKHKWQAEKVNGINGGKLMCETRHELKNARTIYKSSLENHPQENLQEKRIHLDEQSQDKEKRQVLKQKSNVKKQSQSSNNTWSLVSKRKK